MSDQSTTKFIQIFNVRSTRNIRKPKKVTLTKKKLLQLKSAIGKNALEAASSIVVIIIVVVVAWGRGGPVVMVLCLPELRLDADEGLPERPRRVGVRVCRGRRRRRGRAARARRLTRAPRELSGAAEEHGAFVVARPVTQWRFHVAFQSLGSRFSF